MLDVEGWEVEAGRPQTGACLGHSPSRIVEC